MPITVTILTTAMLKAQRFMPHQVTQNTEQTSQCVGGAIQRLIPLPYRCQ